MIIDRKEYLDKLYSKRWNGKVKIITGIAKCGLVAFMTSRLVAMSSSSSFTIFVCHLVIFSIFVYCSLLNS